MPAREMTPEEKAEFDKKHPLGTMLIFSPKQTSAWHKRLKQKSQAAQEASASQGYTPQEQAVYDRWTNDLPKAVFAEHDRRAKAAKDSKAE